MGGGRWLSDDQSSSERSDEDDSSISSFSSSSTSSLNAAAYRDILNSYQTLTARIQTLQQSKDAIKRHKPGDWIEGAGGLTGMDYDLPEVTTLLLVGPRGSGKSSLVNRITKVFEEGEFSLDQAQVSHNLSVTCGSCFLQEYMIPRNSKSLCIYDSRSLSTYISENFAMLCSWMTHGISHGQMVIRDSDTALMRQRIRTIARHQHFSPCQKRIVNFIVFVVDGVSVLKSMDEKDPEYNEMLIANFNCPFLSFKDSKPVVVVTHGDELSLQERARVRIHLGEILGIPPSKQIFDIPDTSDCHTELEIVDMLRYSIEHADRHLPYNQNFLLQCRRILQRKINKLHFDDWDTVFLIIYVCIVLILSIIISGKLLKW